MAEYKKIPLTEDMAGGIGTIFILLFVAAGTVIFIMEGMKLEKYAFYEKKILSLEYGVAGIVESRKEEFEQTYKKAIASGVVLCILSVVPIMMTAAVDAAEIVYVYSAALLLILVACGVFQFVWSSMIYASYEKLLEEGNYTREKKAEENRNKNLSTVYWCTITTIYLAVSFLTGKWASTWIIWPCAGVFFAAVQGIAAMVRAGR